MCVRHLGTTDGIRTVGQLRGDSGVDVVEVDLGIVFLTAGTGVSVVAHPDHVCSVDSGLNVVGIVIGQLDRRIGIGVVEQDLAIVANLALPNREVPRSVVGVLGLLGILVRYRARVRIDPEHVLAEVVEEIDAGLVVGPDETDVVDAVARIEADLSPGAAEAVDTAGNVTGGPLHVVVNERHDVAPGIVLDVQRERIPLVGIHREVSDVDPIDLDEGVPARGGAGLQAHLSPGRAGLPIGPRVDVGPEGRHDRRSWGGDYRESAGGVLPQRRVEGDIAVVVDVEISVVVSVKLERETQGQEGGGEVVIGHHGESTRRHEVHVG